MKCVNQGLKEETFIQTSRRGETGSQAERTCGKVEAGGLPPCHTFVCRYTERNNWGKRQTAQPRVPSQGKRKLQNLWRLQKWEKSPSLKGEFIGRDRQGPRTYTNPPTQESAPEGPNLLVGRGESD